MYNGHHKPYPLPVFILEFLTGKLSEVFMHTSIEPFSKESQVSTSVDPPSINSSSIISNDAYENLISHVDAPGNTITSCSLYLSCLPISHFDEDIMEAMTTLDYPWNDMHYHVYFLPYLDSTTLNTSNTPIAYWGALWPLHLLIILWRISCQVGARFLNPFFKHVKQTNSSY